jgi:hypothetical protein
MAKFIFTVPLLKNTFHLNCFRAQESKGAILKDWGIMLGFCVVSVFKIPEDHIAGLGTLRISILIRFDDEDIHRRQCLADAAHLYKLEVSLLVDAIKDSQTF